MFSRGGEEGVDPLKGAEQWSAKIGKMWEGGGGRKCMRKAGFPSSLPRSKVF